MRFSLVIALVAACAGSSAPPATPQPRATSSIIDPAIPLLARRAQMIQQLDAYRLAAVYPLDARGYPASIFRDGAGRLCPMASLIDHSGGHAIVDWVATHNNTLRLATVKAGPLMDWITTSGLTQEEIALVQGIMTPGEMRVIEARDTILARRAEIAQKLAAVERQLEEQTPKSLPIVTARYVARQGAVPTMPAVEKLAVR